MTVDFEYTLERDDKDYNLYIEITGEEYEPSDPSVGIMSGSWISCYVSDCRDEDNQKFDLTDSEDRLICEIGLEKLNDLNEYYDEGY